MATQSAIVLRKAEIENLQEEIQANYLALFPNAAKLTAGEAKALAQVGLSQGLNVFNKEIYYLKQVKDGVEKAIGPMPGIRGLRKHAHRQMIYEGGAGASYWIQYQQVTDPQEKDRAGAGATDLVIRGELRDTVTMTAYMKIRSMIFVNLSSWGDLLKISSDASGDVNAVRRAVEDVALESLGKPPVVISYGIVKTYELKKEGQNIARPLQMTNGQNALYMAEIRAERRALYKRFDIEKTFGSLDAEAEVEKMDSEFIDGEFSEDYQPEDKHQEQKERSQSQDLRDLGFDEPQQQPTTPAPAQQSPTTPDQRPYPPEVLRTKFAAIVAALEADPRTTITPVDRQIVAKTIKSIFDGDDTQRYAVCRWLTGTASTKDMSAAQIRALMKVTGVHDFGGVIDPNALTEFRQAYAAAIVAEGQRNLL